MANYRIGRKRRGVTWSNHVIEGNDRLVFKGDLEFALMIFSACCAKRSVGTSALSAACIPRHVEPTTGTCRSKAITRPNGSWQQTYAYDSVNRLASATETGTWLENYGYDAFGNRWVTNVVGLPPLTLETPAGPTCP